MFMLVPVFVFAIGIYFHATLSDTSAATTAVEAAKAVKLPSAAFGSHLSQYHSEGSTTILEISFIDVTLAIFPSIQQFSSTAAAGASS